MICTYNMNTKCFHPLLYSITHKGMNLSPKMCYIVQLLLRYSDYCLIFRILSDVQIV